MMKNKVALVTGASRGIGKAIALEFVKNGAKVIINYKNNEEEAEKTLHELRNYCQESMVVKADVSKHEEVEEMFRKVKENYGRIDVLVNNAGILKDNLIINTTNEDWNNVLSVNLKGTFNCLHQAAKMMMVNPEGGKIINVTSTVGIYGNAGQGSYCASKAGIIGLTKSVAKELGEVGITVNALAPGLTDTDMLRSLKKEQVDKLLSQTSLKRIARPEEIAKGALFLASSMSSYVTGQVIVVDGGMVV